MMMSPAGLSTAAGVITTTYDAVLTRSEPNRDIPSRLRRGAGRAHTRPHHEPAHG
ncbi:hypothetical protein AB0G55_14750 [Streptomyces toyocaensis]|uniref:hypothetical protein n=1 Tax=Streptomyces toyocaensis TaxID=55952 RepID=UPI0012FEFD9A|nr:hypothetical protein [Streptomyces toyocaensis]